VKNQQVTLKPQDLVVLLKLACAPKQSFTYASLAKTLFISSSEAHASLARARLAQLAGTHEQEGSISLLREPFRELLLHGARFVFPPIIGPLVRGMPTAQGSPALQDLLVSTNEPPPVWPYSKGISRGMALHPLYPTVPRAAEKDPQLYRALALFDALRAGRARERDFAMNELNLLLA
jgi:hypothetical protein